MKFTFYYHSQKKQLLIILSILILYVFITLKLIGLSSFLGSDTKMLIFGFGSILMLSLAALIVKKIIVKKYSITIDKNIIEIQKRNKVIHTNLSNISMIRLKKNSAGAMDMKFILATGETWFHFSNAMSSKKEDIEKIFKELIEKIQDSIHLIKANEKITRGDLNEYSVDYINKSSVANGLLEKTQKKDKVKKIWNNLLTLFFGSIFIGILILPFFINPKAFYEEEGEKMFFGSKEMLGVKADEFEILTYNIGKDKNHIYFRGEPVDFVDHNSFEHLDSVFYKDKNGIYYENTTLYSKQKLLPLNADYDKATFKAIEFTWLYKDKNNLYTLDLFSKTPLKKISHPEVDLMSLNSICNNWLRDKNSIYFYNDDDFTLAPKVDRDSFECLTYEVFKDKNNVYYLTKNLHADDGEKSGQKGYGILKGADANTFKLINENTFEDKNSTWRITEEGEEVNYRAE